MIHHGNQGTTPGMCVGSPITMKPINALSSLEVPWPSLHMKAPGAPAAVHFAFQLSQGVPRQPLATQGWAGCLKRVKVADLANGERAPCSVLRLQMLRPPWACLVLAESESRKPLIYLASRR